jgi:hypothetical protein
MSMGFIKCPYCGSADGEKLFAIDNIFECYCSSCDTSWEEEVRQYETTTRYQQWMLEDHGEEC